MSVFIKRVELLNQHILLFTHRDAEDPNGGQMILGGSDESLYSGEMHYIPLSAKTYWQVSMDA